MALRVQKTVAASHSRAQPLFVFRFSLRESTVSIYVVLGRLCLISSKERFFCKGLLYEQHCPAETLTEITVFL